LGLGLEKREMGVQRVRVGWSGIEWDKVGCSGMEWDGVG
jgi:hypothetical protein